MTGPTDLQELSDIYGIFPAYSDYDGVERPTSPDTQRALLAANGLAVGSDAEIRETLRGAQARQAARRFPREVIVKSGRGARLKLGAGIEWQVVLEGEDTVFAEGRAKQQTALPPLPSGIHTLSLSAGRHREDVTLLAAPEKLPMILDLTSKPNQWGINLALYGLRSDRNAGQGDFEDLAQMAEIAGRVGAGFLGINPVHNMGYADASAISPYSPSHRGFLNTSCIALDRIPGLENSAAVRRVLAEMAGPFDDLRGSATVPYPDHKAQQHMAFEALYRLFTAEAGDAAHQSFDRFASAGGESLSDFARFEVLSENHGPDWRDWPSEVDSGGDERPAFHIWLQWLADHQLGEAQSRARADGMPLGLYLDLAVGPRRGGGESWCEGDAMARGVSVGAPPDHLSPAGQNWNLAAYAPEKLHECAYAPFRRVLAQTMRHAGLIRIDHALGLSRSFWIPDGGGPGAYIRQPFEALLAVIKIEAERHQTAVIGEDLGLVPDDFRKTMKTHGFYGYSVLQYERNEDGKFRDPAKIPEQVLACFATHDTPTIKGFETGRDIDWWQKFGWIDKAGAQAAKAERTLDVGQLRKLASNQPPDPGASFTDVIHTALAASPAQMVTVQLDDILGEAEAQNLPGTIDQHPNWRRKYDIPVEKLATHPALGTLGDTMKRNRGRRPASRGTGGQT